jgi:hypothetical protein
MPFELLTIEISNNRSWYTKFQKYIVIARVVILTKALTRVLGSEYLWKAFIRSLNTKFEALNLIYF